MPVSVDLRFEEAQLIDITQPVRPGMAVWPGDPEVEFTPALEVAAGDGVNVTRLSLGSHTGTHVDAPAHLWPGAAAADDLPLASLIGPCRVADVLGKADITAADLDRLRLPHSTARLLLRTRSGPAGGPVGLRPDAARWLVDHGIILVGIDGPSVERPDPSGALPVHRALLSAGVVTLEGVDLCNATPGDAWLICLPMRLAGADGAPARAVLAVWGANAWPISAAAGNDGAGATKGE